MQTLNHSLQVPSVITSHALCNVLEAGSPREPLCTDSLLQKHSALTLNPAVQTFPDGASSRWKWAPVTLLDCCVFSQPSPESSSVSSDWNAHSRRETASVPTPRLLHTVGTQYVARRKERASHSAEEPISKAQWRERFAQGSTARTRPRPVRSQEPDYSAPYSSHLSHKFALIKWRKQEHSLSSHEVDGQKGGLAPALSPSDPGTRTQRNPAFLLSSLPASLWDGVPGGRSGEARGGRALLISLPAHTPLSNFPFPPPPCTLQPASSQA